MGRDRGPDPELMAAVERLDDLLQEFDQHPQVAVRARAFELLQCVDAVHRPGLGRLAQLLASVELSERAIEEPEVRLLFELYDLVEGGDGAPARLPDAAAVPTGGFVPLSSLRVVKRPGLVWRRALGLGEVPAGEVRGLELEGEWVLIANLGQELYAYRDACPGTPLPLRGGQVEGTALRCPWHGCRFDLRGGKRLDANGPGLGVIPIAVEGDEVRIGVLAGAAL